MLRQRRAAEHLLQSPGEAVFESLGEGRTDWTTHRHRCCDSSRLKAAGAIDFYIVAALAREGAIQEGVLGVTAADDVRPPSKLRQIPGQLEDALHPAPADWGEVIGDQQDVAQVSGH